MTSKQDVFQKSIAESISDEQNFIMFMQKNQERLYRLAFHLLGDTEEAKDTVQEAFVRLWKKKKNIHWKDAHSWILRTTINLCLDFLRRRKFRKDNEELSDQIPDTAPNPLDNCLNSEFQAILRTAIQGLSEDYRIVILLRDMEGMSYDEISETLGVPISKVKSDLFRGRRKIREMLRPFIEVNE